MNIRLRQLRAFKAIVETGTVSSAAMVLGLTQSSVSKILSGFELDLGFALFDRKGRRLTLSEKGRAFYREVGNAIEMLESIEVTARDIRNDKRTRLRIAGIGPLALSGFLPEVLARFETKYPGFDFTIEQKTRVEIEAWIANQHAELGFTLLPVRSEQIGHTFIAAVRALAIVSVDHPLADAGPLSPETVADADLVMPKQSVRLRRLIDANFIQAGVPLRPRYETSNAITTAQLVRKINGIAVVDPFTLTGMPLDQIKVLRWNPEIVLNYGAIWSLAKPPRAAVTGMINVATEVARELDGILPQQAYAE